MDGSTGPFFPSPPVPVPIFWLLYWAHKLQLVSPLLFCSIVFPVLLQGLGTYLSFLFPSVLFCCQPERQNSLFDTSFFLNITRSGRLAEIKWSVCISKSQRTLCVLFSRTDSGLCIYHLFIWPNLNFLHNSQLITLSTLSCLVRYFLW